MPAFRVLARRAGLVALAVAATGALTLTAAATEAGSEAPEFDPDLVSLGNQLFQANCATCHGDGAEGLVSPDPSGGPSLIGVGAASVDFMLRTGRMPMTNQFDRLARSTPKFDATERAAIVAFVTSLAPGEGPGIPDISGYEGASLARGLEQFTTNCAACHGPTAAGVAVGQRDVSSDLGITEPIEIAEAIRSGPGVMPVFGEDVLTQEDLEAVVAWVVDLRDREQPGGLSIGRSGPVSEGMVAWVVGLGLLGVVMYLLGDKAGDTGHGHDVEEDERA